MNQDTVKRPKKDRSFTLVSVTENGNEVWRDDSTGFIWGDRVNRRYAHSEAMATKDGWVQPLACKSKEGKQSTAEIADHFQVPSKEDFLQAIDNGALDALPNFRGSLFWTSEDSKQGFVVDGSSGDPAPKMRESDFNWIRCLNKPVKIERDIEITGQDPKYRQLIDLTKDLQLRSIIDQVKEGIPPRLLCDQLYERRLPGWPAKRAVEQALWDLDQSANAGGMIYGSYWRQFFRYVRPLPDGTGPDWDACK